MKGRRATRRTSRAAGTAAVGQSGMAATPCRTVAPSIIVQVMTRRLRRFATALLGLLLLQTSALEGSLACLMPPAAGGAAAGAPERGNATAATYGAADDHAGHDRHAGRSSADTDGSAPDGQRQS